MMMEIVEALMSMWFLMAENGLVTCWWIGDDVHWCSDDVDLHEESRRLGSCGDKGDGDDRNSDGSM